ncbi:hypothetical protein H2Y56_18825 [Pectobacterium aroidearum]|uniref:Uncharacterized protein n=1 Tax=Pectobacterium aroidearum TaxID=1201031 RepID=A0ABR5ZHT6_9GAMM|nr:hypothetical protein [Pectobacterium aroidearum]MBA5234148.1 hypothetical protein [Pectobacterium aroidearum]MBA5739340.1 hypothetical protein [Pectobacterium aroidearum]
MVVSQPAVPAGLYGCCLADNLPGLFIQYDAGITVSVRERGCIVCEHDGVLQKEIGVLPQRGGAPVGGKNATAVTG